MEHGVPSILPRNTSCSTFEQSINLEQTYCQWALAAPDWQTLDDESNLIWRCPGICTNIYGDGNPDISGVGAMTAFAIQALLIMIFGPLRSLFFALLPPKADSRTHLTLWRFQTVFDKILSTSNLICLRTLVSSTVTLQQTTPLFDVFMMEMALIFKKVLFMHADLVYTVDAALKQHHSKEAITAQWSLKWLATLVIRQLTVACTVYAQHVLTTSLSKENIISTFAIRCVVVLDYPSPIVSKSMAVFDGSSATILFLAELTLTLILPRLLHIRDGPRVHKGVVIMALFIPISLAVNIIQIGTQVVKARIRLQEKAGTVDLDNVWGFGQVTAVIVWFPIFKEIVTELAFSLVSNELWLYCTDATCKCSTHLQSSDTHMLMFSQILLGKGAINQASKASLDSCPGSSRRD